MNLDEYFSKYIDAELSTAEDAEMRALLADNDAARLEFEHAALISVAMMAESEAIDTPDELFLATDALIMSKFEENRRKVAALPPIRRKSAVALSAAFVLCFLMAGEEIRWGNRDSLSMAQEQSTAFVEKEGAPLRIVGPSSLGGSAPRSAGVRASSVYTTGATLASFANNASVGKDRETSGVPTSVAGLGSNVSAAGESVEKTIRPNASFEEAIASSERLRVLRNEMIFRNPQVIAMQENDDSRVMAQRETTPQSQAMSLAVVSDAIPGLHHVPSAAEQVQLGTFVGSIVKTSASTGSAQHFSQSIGYPVNESVNMGVELGTFSIVANIPGQFGTTAGLVQSGETKQKTTLLSLDNATTPPTDGSGSGHIGSGSGELSTERSVVWGAAFIERSVVSTNDLSVKARLAVGTSEGGPLVFARAMSVMSVYGPVSLTLGTEGRMFFYDDKNTSNNDKNLQTMMSVMYGVQIKF